MYRPTVRYDDSFKEYVDSLFDSTRLDRNQIIRLALFMLGHSREGKEVLNQFATTPLPQPLWEQNSHVLWYGKPLEIQLEGVTSDVDKESVSRYQREVTRPDVREVYEQTKGEQIIFRIGNSILLPR